MGEEGADAFQIVGLLELEDEGLQLKGFSIVLFGKVAHLHLVLFASLFALDGANPRCEVCCYLLQVSFLLQPH